MSNSKEQVEKTFKIVVVVVIGNGILSIGNFNLYTEMYIYINKW